MKVRSLGQLLKFPQGTTTTTGIFTISSPSRTPVRMGREGLSETACVLVFIAFWAVFAVGFWTLAAAAVRRLWGAL